VRIVLDTQVWLDWLLFRDPSAVPIAGAQAAGRIEIVIDEACAQELARAAAYDFGRHSIDAEAQARLMADCGRLATRVAVANDAGAGLPRCSDPDDQKFLTLARSAGADMLISRDQALLALARKLPFTVLHPSAFADALARQMAS
jgi:putative PIN family toxin of toxin-antitoxin system